MPAIKKDAEAAEVISRKKGAPTAANARLPELADPGFDVFAADVWCLGAMLRDVSRFSFRPVRRVARTHSLPRADANIPGRRLEGTFSLYVQ